MFNKLSAKKNQRKLSFAPEKKIIAGHHLAYEISGDNLTIRQLQADDTSFAKALCQLIEKGILNLSIYKHVEIIINNPNFQMMTFYAKIPPNLFGKGLNPQARVDIRFSNHEAALGIFDSLTSAWPDRIETFLEDKMNVSYHLPIGGKKHLLEHLVTAQDFMQKALFAQPGKSFSISRPSKTIIQKIPEAFEKIKAYLKYGTILRTKLLTEIPEATKYLPVIFHNPEPNHNTPDLFKKSHTMIPKQNYQNIIKKCDLPKAIKLKLLKYIQTNLVQRFVEDAVSTEPAPVIEEIDRDSRLLENEVKDIIHKQSIKYSTSDESSNLLYNNQTLYVIDAGYPSTPKDIYNLIAEAAQIKDPAKKIKNISINITHAHSDHTAYLLKSLETAAYCAQKYHLRLDLNIPTSTIQQFIGFYLKNFSTMKRLLELKLLKLNFKQYTLPKTRRNKENLYLTPALPKNFAHYINDSGFIQESRETAYIFMPDLNTPLFRKFDPALMKELMNYFAALVQRLKERGNQNVYIFMDTDEGHLPGIKDYLPIFRDKYLNEWAKEFQLKLYLKEIHAKNNYTAETEILAA